MRATPPKNEADRIAVLHRYRLMDTPPEASFDRLTRMAARAFSTPVSLITLLDEDRQFFKSHHGVDIQEVPRELSLCSHSILSDDVTVATDTTADVRFSDNPFVVNSPNVRFYAGAPLKSPGGFNLGTICVLDVQPREMPDPELLALLKDLADEAVELMEFHREKQKLVTLSEKLVTESRKLEVSRRDIDKWQRRAAQALEAGNMGHWERDAVTDLITFSPKLEQMLGIDHDRYDGSVEQWLKHIHPEDRQSVLDRIQDARDAGSNYTFKYRPFTPDGSERWITTSGTYRKDAAGGFAGAYGVSWDSTAAELAERRLKMSEELFRALSDSAPIGIFRTDTAQRLEYVNPKLAAFNGVPERDLLGDGWVSYIHPEDREQLQNGIANSTALQEPDEFEHRLLLTDGTIRWIRVRAVPLRDENGKFVGKVGTADDITQQRQMIEDLKNAKDKAEIANQAKDMFLANVSHELRTPLNGVLGMNELLMDSGLNEVQMEMAQTVRDSARGLLSVVNDMLDLSRIEAGRFFIDRQPFNLRNTIQQTVSLFRADAMQKGITLSVNYANNMPDSYQGDSGRVRQILTNFLSNAMKFQPTGEIYVEAGGELNNGSWDVRLSVTDSGSGISPEDQKKLFRPFSQLDSSTTRRHGGAGLGLSICRRLAELMGGEVGVDSAVGHGSTFWVRLPLSYCPTQTLNSQEKRKPSGSGSRVLLVEDNPVNQRVATGVLRKLGWDVDVADNGISAVELCKRSHYAVVLMDCQMPEMDGYAATRDIRIWEKSHGKPGVPIVALTAHAMNGDKERCLEAGMNDHLAKPFGLEELRSALDRWVVVRAER